MSLEDSKQTILFKKFLGFVNSESARPIDTELQINANPITFLNKIPITSVPSTAPIVTDSLGPNKSKTTNKFIFYYESLGLKSLFGTSDYAFLADEDPSKNSLIGAIPANYGKDYKVLLEAGNGGVIQPADYVFDRDAGLITVYGQARSQVGKDNPPKITFFRYEGPMAKFLDLYGSNAMEGSIDMSGYSIRKLKDLSYNLLEDVDISSAVNKKFIIDFYKDISNNFLSLSGGTMRGAIDMSNNSIINLKDTSYNLTADANGSNAINKKFIIDFYKDICNNFLSLSGGTMRGAINMSNNFICNLPDILNTDKTKSNFAINKQYVDTALKSMSSNVLYCNVENPERSYYIYSDIDYDEDNDDVLIWKIGSNNVTLGSACGTGSDNLKGIVAVGAYSGNSGGDYTVSVGSYYNVNGISDSQSGQKEGAISVGRNAGKQTQGLNAIAIGVSAADTDQANYSIAIGYEAGKQGTGANSILLGRGTSTTQPNSIVINGNSTNLAATSSGLFMDPIRNRSNAPAQFSNILYYNTSTKEIAFGEISGADGVHVSNWSLYKALSNVDMCGSSIINLANINPALGLSINGSNAVNRNYVDGNFLRLSNGSSQILQSSIDVCGASYRINMNGSRITGLSDQPISSTDAVNSNFVISNVSNWASSPAITHINVSGNYISNTALLNYSSVSNTLDTYNTYVANIKFVRDYVACNAGSNGSSVVASNVMVKNDSNIMNSNATITFDAGSNSYINGINLRNIISNNPLADYSYYVVNKEYVDTEISGLRVDYTVASNYSAYFASNYSNFSSNYSNFDSNNSNFNSNYSNFSNNYSIFNSNYSNFDSNNSNFSNNYSNFTSNYSNFDSNNSNFVSNYSNFTSNNSNFVSNYSNFTSNYSNFDSNNSNFVSNFSNFTSNYSNFDTNNSNFVSNYSNFSSNYSNFDSNNSNFVSNYSNFSSNYSNFDTNNSNFVSNYSNFSSNYSNFDSNNSNFVSNYSNFSSNYSNFDSNNSNFVSNYSNFNSNYFNFDTNNSNFVSNFSNFTSNNSNFVSNYSNFNSNYSNFDTNNSNFVSNYSNFNSNYSNFSNNYSNFTSNYSIFNSNYSNLSSNYLKLDGTSTMGGNINMGNYKITNLASLSTDPDNYAVNIGLLKSYVHAYSGGGGGGSGSGGISVIGSNFGEYLYYDPNQTINKWVLGSSNIILGKNAAQTVSDATYGRNLTVSIGNEAGNSAINRAGSIAIGSGAGKSNQEFYSLALGYNAGFVGQKTESIAIGIAAGSNNQGAASIAIGKQAGASDFGTLSIAIGEAAAFQNAGNNGIAIGNQAGYRNQGEKSICIGNLAGCNSQGANSIVINATGSELTNSNANTFTVKPIASRASQGSGKQLYWDPVTGEIFVVN